MDPILPIVLDASVAIKLVVLEPGTANAQAVLLDEDERVAPDWLLTEIASGLSQKVRYEGLAIDRAIAALAASPRFVDRFLPAQPFLSDAIKLAVELEHALYDCLYLVIAIAEGGHVLTADQKFYKSAARAGYGERMQLLQWAGER